MLRPPWESPSTWHKYVLITSMCLTGTPVAETLPSLPQSALSPALISSPFHSPPALFKPLLTCLTPPHTAFSALVGIRLLSLC